MKAVILAAGKGVRFKPITDTIPKVMINVAGKPMLERQLENLLEAGIDEAILVVGYKKEVIRDYFKDNFNGVKITYVEQKEQLGSADAVKVVKNVVGNDDFLVINGDVILEGSFLKELKETLGYPAVIVGRETDEPWRYGCLVIEDNLIKDIVEKPEKGTEPGNIINIGVYKFSRKVFDAIDKVPLGPKGEYEIVDAIRLLIKKEGVSYLEYNGLCLDIGNQEDLKKAEFELNKGVNKK